MKSTNILFMRYTTNPDFSAYFVELLGSAWPGSAWSRHPDAA